jgi:hypothetical protein
MVDFLTYLINLRPAIPMSTERPCTIASNSEIRRWADGGMVEINGLKMKATDKVNYPIKSLVFFPNSKRRTTLV